MKMHERQIFYLMLCPAILRFALLNAAIGGPHTGFNRAHAKSRCHVFRRLAIFRMVFT